MRLLKSKVVNDNPRGAPPKASSVVSAHGVDHYQRDLVRLLVQFAARADESQVMDFLMEHDPRLAERLREELRHGSSGTRSKLASAIERIALEDAGRGLEGMYRLRRMAADGELAIAWPVPPHIVDELGSDVPVELQFAAEDHLPPHLQDELDIRQLDAMLPQEIVAAFRGVKGILADGRNRGRVTVRRSLVNIFQVLRESNLTLFLHHVPHIPPHAVVAEVGPEVEVVEVR